MTTSEDVFLAILALDAYNRDYGVGMIVTGSQIGNAQVIENTISIEQQNAGFFAQEYDWDGKTVISYRGTDSLSGAKCLC